MSDYDDTAYGLVETRGLIAALEAADAMVKTATVRLVKIEKTVPAMMTVQVVGETSAVQAAVDAGRAAAERIGDVIGAHVIARPSDEVRVLQKLTIRAAVEAPADLGDMTVRALRARARETSGLSIQGREIARASKADLLAAFRKQQDR